MSARSDPEQAGAAEIAARIAAELAVEMGRADVVATGCEALEGHLGFSAGPDLAMTIAELGRALERRTGAVAEPLARLLESASRSLADPWPFLDRLLRARDRQLVRRGLEVACALAEAGRLLPGAATADALIPLAVDEDDAESRALLPLARRLLGEGATGPEDPIERLLLAPGPFPRRLLAARLLDLDEAVVPPARARAILGEEAYARLAEALAYSRAGHADLLHLAPEGAGCRALAALTAAKSVCGERLFGEVVARIGWKAVALGIEARRLVPIRCGGAVPIHVRPEEAFLFEGGPGRAEAPIVLVVAHGGLPDEGPRASPSEASEVARYRAMNLAHAEALQEILDLGPLTVARVARLVGLLDRIVADFVALFADHADECRILPSVWSGIRTPIVEAAEREGGGAPVSTDLTRAVLAFEDPRAAGEVTTLHGLKRYLHQRGLKLGFKLVRAAGTTHRTVDLVLATGERIVEALRAIRYVDFEPVADAKPDPAGIPYPVRIVADAFARGLLHGHRTFPAVRVHGYGNEVHYFLTYGTHPALLRIDLSPPQRGGMIDLEYYGVSRYDLEAHPARDLPALRELFRALDFDVNVEPNTRVHARYDKERARSLGELAAKAEALFRLAPYLMDLDWILGDLRLDADAKAEVVRAWADRFARWGILPLDRILTADRLGIVRAIASEPSGDREVLWDGRGAYRDRVDPPAAPAILEGIGRSLEALGVEGARFAPDALPPFGELALEGAVFGPLREAAARGEVTVEEGRLRAVPRARSAREPAATAFARILAGPDRRLVESARLARRVASIEAGLAFRATGAVNRHDVEHARVALRGGSVDLHVLRAPRGRIRLAIAADGPDVPAPSPPLDAAALGRALRAAGYGPAGADPGGEDRDDDPASLREIFARVNPLGAPPPLPTERIVAAGAASPGRAVGRAVLGADGRRAEDLAGAVLLAPALRPEDGVLLHAAAGVATTGGGILSHAGLIAAQARKPAVIVDGTWRAEGTGRLEVLLAATVFREEDAWVEGYRVAVRRDARAAVIAVREGDLVVVDADQGSFQAFGAGPLALGLHEGIVSLAQSRAALADARDPARVLVLRGARARALHRLEGILSRLDDPALARFAVHELLSGPHPGGDGLADTARLIETALANPAVAEAVRERLLLSGRGLARRLRDAHDDADLRIARAASAHEVLARRLDVLRLREAHARTALLLGRCGLSIGAAETPLASADVDLPARHRLEAMRDRLASAVAASGEPSDDPALRHRLRTLDRLAALVGEDAGQAARRAAAVERLRAWDRAAAEATAGRFVLAAAEAGLEVAPEVGWKAANLAELGRLAGPESSPPWCVVTDAAFRVALGAPCPARRGGRRLGEAVESLLARDDLDPASRAGSIRELWEETPLPPEVAEAVASAYRDLGDPADPEPFVAVRSSAREEDTESAANAGEFDTFLFVRGTESLLRHLRLAWAGLWNERALRARAASGAGSTAAGGGVIVQRMARSRVSGVLQTVHVAAGEPGELVVNAGLGLGEGIVAGAVGCDQIVVDKASDLERGPLRFRYRVADKRQQVVFDARAGAGTVRTETAYHQRFRAALEYAELLELTGAAARLEGIFGYPLDIEFGIEGRSLRLLQCRPVAAWDAILRETLESYPFPPHAPVEEVPS